MITYHNGDILESDADVICHQVNCKGVMGAGLAKQIREAWPCVYEEYKDFCDIGDAELGTIQICRIGGRAVVNMFAQDGYGTDRQYTDYNALRICLSNVRDIFKDYVIAIPHGIGCGLGGGDWNIVNTIIEEVFGGPEHRANIQIWRLPQLVYGPKEKLRRGSFRYEDY